MANHKNSGPRKMWSQRLPVRTINQIVAIRDRLQGERGEAVSLSDVVELAVKEMGERVDPALLHRKEKYGTTPAMNPATSCEDFKPL